MIHPNSIIQAAEQAERAAGTIEAAVHRLALMAEAGYGGNICALVELLGSDRIAEETRLRQEVAKLRSALERVAAPTYGTEIHDTDAERADNYWRHLERIQGIARGAL